MSLDDLQAQLRGALDQQFAALKQHYEQAITEVRRQAASDAERDTAARLQTARAEWDSALTAILEKTRAETLQQAEATARAHRNALEHELQQQLDSTVQHAVNSVKKATELELQALRRRVEEDVQAERQRGEAAQQAAVEAERQRGETAQQAALEAERGRLQETHAAEGQRAQQAFDSERQRLQQELEAERAKAQQTLDERQRLQQELEAERAKAQQALDGERQRLQQELEAERAKAQHASDVERERQQELEAERAGRQQAIDAERERALQALEEERSRARAELETVQQLLEADVASAQAAAAMAREAAEQANAELETASARAAAAEAVAADTAASARPSAPPDAAALARVPDALRALDAARSLSQTLEALLQHAGAIAGRAALFLINGDRLKSWKTIEIPEIDVQTVESSIGGRDLLARAIQMGQSMTASPDQPAPPFARLAADRPAVAAPLMVAGRPVAVVYADPGSADPPDGWIEAVDLVTRHASAIAALRAAARTLDLLRGDAVEPVASPENGNGNGEESARRYARLLVSEIKLYNEAAVRTGRQQRDLRQRLRGEIDRAQRLYEERVPAAVGGRDQYFHQELVQTLADGDPTLLGN
jgi:hypothetical protein